MLPTMKILKCLFFMSNSFINHPKVTNILRIYSKFFFMNMTFLCVSQYNQKYFFFQKGPLTRPFWRLWHLAWSGTWPSATPCTLTPCPASSAPSGSSRSSGSSPSSQPFHTHSLQGKMIDRLPVLGKQSVRNWFFYDKFPVKDYFSLIPFFLLPCSLIILRW